MLRTQCSLLYSMTRELSVSTTDYSKLKSVPKVYAVIVKCDHNFLDFQSFDEISFVLVSGVEGGNFKPKTFQKIKS